MTTTATTVRNYSTKVPTSRTIAEMHSGLVKHGASRIATDYRDQTACGLTFTLPTPHGARHFSLPVDVDAMHALLTEQDHQGNLRHGAAGVRASKVQAERVAWRVMADWLDAQLTLVATRMASLDQVMLPYLHVDGERTLYQAYRDQETAALPEGRGTS